MNRQFINIIGLFVILLSNYSLSFIYRISHFATPNHNIYLLYDYHKQTTDFNLSFCKQQIKDILEDALRFDHMKNSIQGLIFFPSIEVLAVPAFAKASAGVPTENRTQISAVKGRCPNR
jgi:hypothetical protein